MKPLPKNRFSIIDVAAVIAAAIFISYFFHRISLVLDYQWNWSAIPGYFFYRDDTLGHYKLNILAKGFLMTIKISVWATVMALFLGIVSGVMGAKGSTGYRMISRTYVETIRNIPSLVLVIIFYYFVSSQFLDVIGLDTMARKSTGSFQDILAFFFTPPDQINSFVSAVIALGIYEGAYVCEIVRGGIISIQKGQWEASWSLGLNPAKTFMLIILPQALRKIAFPLAGQFISTIKDSAIVSVISIQELTFQGMELMAVTFLTFEIWITITLLYLALTFILSQSVAFLEKRYAIK
jgi:polar amino acid transport system permease protein